MAQRLIGYERSDFSAKDGTMITGYNVYIGTPVSANGDGDGMKAERLYISDNKLAKQQIDLAALMGSDIQVFYNRFGKIASIACR